MIRVAIHGAAGRMGRNLIAACLDAPGLSLAAAIEHDQHPDLGRDAGEISGYGAVGISVSADLSATEFDVAVDFSRPDAALRMLAACSERGAAAVIGTTGFEPDQKAEIGRHAGAIPVVMAPNMGVGINLLLGLVEAAARALGDDYDAEIIESHHRFKVDSPSGTALRLGEMVAAGRGQKLNDVMAGAHEGRAGERQRGDIGFAVVRGGDIVGEHTTLFAGDGERIELTHKASSRRVFAAGAMRAASWVQGRPAGLYDMQDVLNLSLA